MTDGAVRLEVHYSPPLDWAFFMRYLGARGTHGVELIDGQCYRRSVEADGLVGTFALSPSGDDRLHLRIEGEVGRAADRVVSRIRRMFDLDADLSNAHNVLKCDDHLAPLIAANPGVRIPGAWSPFELLVRTIVGQQVTVKAATTIMGRLAERFGRPTGFPGGPASFFPTPAAIADGNMEGIGMPGRRVQTLRSVARAIADQTLPPLDDGCDVSAVKAAMLELPGIGPWTVEYFALRALRDTDAWPETDLVLKRAIEQCPSARPLSRRTSMDHWRPYRGYAAMHLWNRASQEQTQKKVRGTTGEAG